MPGQTLIIFDEIQAAERALTSLKYFNEKSPEQHLLVAGSLLGISMPYKASFPVGKVDFLDLYPLSFELAIQWLLDSGVFIKNPRVSKPEMPLKAFE